MIISNLPRRTRSELISTVLFRFFADSPKGDAWKNNNLIRLGFFHENTSPFASWECTFQLVILICLDIYTILIKLIPSLYLTIWEFGKKGLEFEILKNDMATLHKVGPVRNRFALDTAPSHVSVPPNQNGTLAKDG